MQPRYIVEITIHPFFYKAVADPVALQLHPVYEDEEGRCYFRRTASTAAVSRSAYNNEQIQGWGSGSNPVHPVLPASIIRLRGELLFLSGLTCSYI